ncbi:MAG: DUF1501 domain-containing protein, partial [Planctomycetaceae bacterium]
MAEPPPAIWQMFHSWLGTTRRRRITIVPCMPLRQVRLRAPFRLLETEMLSLFPAVGRSRGLTRRYWLRMAACATLPAVIPAATHASDVPGAPVLAHRPTAKQCIYIFLCGGPSQPDLWDLKPAAPAGVRTVFESIDTTAPGIQFGSLIPQVARHADKLAVIRSLTHDNNDHNFAIARSLLGQLPERPGEVHVARDDHPGLGGLLHKVLGPLNGSPAWVVLPRPFTTYSPPYKGQSAGFLGPAWDPITLNKEARGSLTDAPVQFDSIRLPEGVDGSRFAQRIDLASSFDSAAGAAQGGAGSKKLAGTSRQRMESAYNDAVSLITTSATRQAFELEREPERVRDRYGRNEYGQSFLLARRLVEAGVRTINVFWTFFDT